MKHCSRMATERFFEGAQHAKIYATFRPRPPEQLTERIVAFLKEKYEGQLELCVDVGRGNGQCSTPFAHHFQKVLATDVSSAQIQVAKTLVHPMNVEFRNCTAESIPATAGSTQLVNASTAAHWFDLPAFFQEANRVLCSNGVIALSSYGLSFDNCLPTQTSHPRLQCDRHICPTNTTFDDKDRLIKINELYKYIISYQ